MRHQDGLLSYDGRWFYCGGIGSSASRRMVQSPLRVVPLSRAREQRPLSLHDMYGVYPGAYKKGTYHCVSDLLVAPLSYLLYLLKDSLYSTMLRSPKARSASEAVNTSPLMPLVRLPLMRNSRITRVPCGISPADVM